MSANESQATATQPLERGEQLAHRALRLSLVVNSLLAVLKLVAGALLASPALIADGWHSLADTLSSAVAWLGFRLGREPADDDHHFGHGNLEALGSLLVGLGLVVGGALILWNSFQGVGQEISSTGTTLAMSVALASALMNLGLASVTHGASKQISSLSLRALTLDNLGDALSSAVVLLAIVMRRAGYPEVELLVAGAIGVLIAAMGIGSVRSGFDVLMVRVSDPSLRGNIAQTAARHKDVRGVQNVRIHPLGSDMRVDLEVNVDGQLTVSEGHDIAHAVADAVTQAHVQVKGVHVHVNPCPRNLDGNNIFPS